MYAFSGNSLFFAIAGICQVVLGIIFMVRAKRNNWALAAGMLFLLNGALSLTSMYAVGFHTKTPEYDLARKLTYLIDPPTSFIILYLALAYPNPIRGFTNRRWLLGAILGVGALLQFSSLYWNDGLYDRLFTGRGIGGWQAVLYVSFIQEIAWAAVLVRWAQVMLRGAPDWKFSLLACALAVRASHVGIVAFGTRINRIDPGITNLLDLPSSTLWHLGISAVPIIALVYALFILLAPSLDATRAGNRAPAIFTGFLLLGVVEALFSMASLIGAAWTKAPFLFLDSLVLRPVLVWGSLFAIPFHRAGKIAGMLVFFVLCATAFLPSGLDAFKKMQITGGAAWFFASLFALGMMALGAKFLFPLLKEETWIREAEEDEGLQT